MIRPDGHATFNVGIRTLTIQGARAECGIGSGITLDSRADAEFEECLVKRRFLFRASATFELIETLRLENGHYWLLERHLERLEHTALHFGFEYSVVPIRNALYELAAAHPQDAWRVRLQVDRQGASRLEAHPLEANAATVSVALARTPIASDNEFLRHKTTERSAYASHASGPHHFDTLLYNERNELCEFTRGNIIVEIAGHCLTPPLSCGLLPGVLRQELLASGEIEEGVVTLSDLRRATRLWFINSVRGRLLARFPDPP